MIYIAKLGMVALLGLILVMWLLSWMMFGVVLLGIALFIAIPYYLVYDFFHKKKPRKFAT